MPHILEGPGLMFLGLGATCGPGDTPLHDAGVFDRSVTQVAEQRFPVLGWDPILKAMAIAGEFAATGKLWQRKELCPPPPSDPTEDIAKLIEYRDGGRNQRREEIALCATPQRITALATSHTRSDYDGDLRGRICRRLLEAETYASASCASVSSHISNNHDSTA